MGYIYKRNVKDEYGVYGPYYILRNSKGDYIEIIAKGDTTKNNIRSCCEDYDVDISEKQINKFKDELRFGHSSDPNILQDAFEKSKNIKDLDESTGQNKADDMNVLIFEDDSKAYIVKPEDATTGLTPVDDKERFIKNNIRCSRIIESLNGNSCRCEITEDSNDSEYLVKEGIEGKLVLNSDKERLRDIKDSINRTISSAYFVGNTDLHAGNMIVGNDDELYIIDHDSSINSGSFNGMPDISHFSELKMLNRIGGDVPEIPDNLNIRKHIYDKAVDIKKGNEDIPLDEDTKEYQYIQDAVNKAIRTATLDDDYNVPDSVKPDYLLSPLNGYESLDSFNEGMNIKYVKENGEIHKGSLSTIFPNKYLSILNESEGTREKIQADQLNSIIKVE